MSQNWYAGTPAPTNDYQTDLNNMKEMFATIKSMFSGTMAPSNVVEGQVWRDTDNYVWKAYTGAAWVGLMHGDASQKIWIYRNDALAGWVIDSTVTDRVLSLKGGSLAYNVSGGGNAGTWTQPDGTLVAANLPPHTHVVDGGSHRHSTPIRTGGEGAAGLAGNSSATTVYTGYDGGHTHDCGNGPGTSSAHNHGTTYRPAAAVGTLQYLDI